MKKWKSKMVLGVLLLPLVSSGCNVDNNHETAVARVGGADISTGELMAEVKNSGLPATKKNLELLLGKLITQRAAEVQAKATKLDDDPEFQRSVRLLALDVLRKRYRQEALSEMPLEVSEDEIRAAYDRSQDRFFRPARARVALIAFENTGGEAAQLATESHQKLQSVVDDARDFLFQKLAANHSTDRASRYRGGDVGYLHEGEASTWPREVVDAAFGLQESGDLSAIIQTEKTLYILKLLERQESYTEAYAKVSQRLRQELLAKKHDALKNQVEERLMRGLNVSRNQALLASLSVPAEEPAVELPGPPLD